MSQTHPTARPSGPVVDAVEAFARAACPPYLMHHNHRTFLFGRMLVPEAADLELAFVAALLHDIALVDPHIGETTFEQVGADVAAHFLEGQGWEPERIRLVERAIIHHIDLAPHDVPEMRIVQAGAAFDVAGLPLDAITNPATSAILAQFPRGSMAVEIQSAIQAEIARQPCGSFARLDEQINLTRLVMQNPLDQDLDR
jgi:hypothetical protein